MLEPPLRPLALPPHLLTPRLEVRSPRETDGRSLAAAVSESIDDLAEFFGWAGGLRKVGVDDELASMAERATRGFAEARNPSYYAFLRDDPQHMVGEICLLTDEWELGVLEYTVWIRSSLHGSRMGREFSTAVLNAAFGAADVELFKARVEARNAASRRLVRCLGFKRWGSQETFDRFVLFPADWYRGQLERAATPLKQSA